MAATRRTTTTRQELLAADRAGGDIDDLPGVGEWPVGEKPLAPVDHPDGAALVGRSLRMSVDTYARIRRVADAQGTSWSVLVREWIEHGLQAAESDASPNSLVALHRSIGLKINRWPPDRDRRSRSRFTMITTEPGMRGKTRAGALR